MTVDHGAPEPAYQQLAAILRARIAKGEWHRAPCRPGSNSSRNKMWAVTPYILRSEGLVFTVPRRSTYVSTDAK